MKYFQNQSIFKNNMLFISPLGPVEATKLKGSEWLVTTGLGVHTTIQAQENATEKEIYNILKKGN